jgi:hypothetical protein
MPPATSHSLKKEPQVAEIFQPRFVDLVRSYSTTVGAGDFVLGAAVNGYGGFGDVLQVGERFYYSAVGVDKPAEREVGRGTLLADGTIGREPIGGVLTDFTAGVKSVALVAAAEWFAAMRSGYGTGAIGYAVGAGGSAVQAGSKSAPVTVDALSGQITTTADSLAGGGGNISFVVNDSGVAATDVVVLNLASGAATDVSYRYWVSRVADGFFKITLENKSGGALGEALTFNFAVVKAVAA